MRRCSPLGDDPTSFSIGISLIVFSASGVGLDLKEEQGDGARFDMGVCTFLERRGLGSLAKGGGGVGADG